MILVDTNVVSEMMKPVPSGAVRGWFDGQEKETLYLSTVSLAELLVGVFKLPDGKRKRDLRASLDEQLQRFAGRILSLNEAAAYRYAELATAARARGAGFELADAYIAAIAASYGYAVATRDATAFNAFGVPVINPWESAA